MCYYICFSCTCAFKQILEKGEKIIIPLVAVEVQVYVYVDLSTVGAGSHLWLSQIFVVSVLNNNREHINTKIENEKLDLSQGSVFEGVRDIKNKENRKSDMPDAHICISSKPIPSPQSCQAQLAGGKKDYLFI